MDYYIYPLWLTFGSRYVLWVEDGVFISGDNKVVSFITREAADSFASIRGLRLASETPSELDLTWITNDGDDIEELDCIAMLNAWNFFTDVANSLPQSGIALEAEDKKLNTIYEKLFWGNNLPAVTPSGERYIPEWTAQERTEMRQFFLAGLALLTDNLEEEG